METPLEAVGVARRTALATGRERWQLPPSHAALVDELLALGRAGIGGFVEGGVDESGPWLIREAARQRLREALDEADAETGAHWRAVVERVAAISRRLATVEARGDFPGLIGPHAVVLDPELDGGPWLAADELIASKLGAASSSDTSGYLRREWLTPGAAEGRPADAGDNRWLLGLVLYRWLAGRGPFAGLGLRAAIEQLRRGVPPLPDAVARMLPPGLQAAILRMLDPDPGRRPSSALAIAEALEGFVQAGASVVPTSSPQQPWPQQSSLQRHATPAHATPAHATPAHAATPAPAHAPPLRPPPAAAPPPAIASSPRRRRGRGRGIFRAAVILTTLGLGVAAGVSLLEGVPAVTPAASREPARDETTPAVGDRSPLDAAHTSAEDCASCHPRQTAEWSRSVMGHSAKSPLFQGLEILIEEQVGRSDDCPGGAGILRSAEPITACRDPNTNIAITGSGGALWCVNCHTPRENLAATLPAWDGVSFNSPTRRPLRDLQPEATSEGIDCGFCHQVHGPVQPGNERLGRYEGNPSWISTVTGQTFAMRPEDRQGLPGIANSGYLLDPNEFLTPDSLDAFDAELVPGDVHRRPSAQARAYLQSSQFCGACHDVRLFGSDAVATPATGQHFRRLRNAYSEWADWAALEQRQGREPADCQDCHMSSFPGICVQGPPPSPTPGETDLSALRRGCPPGTHFESRDPGELPSLRVAAGSGERREVTTHYFSGVDIPLTPAFDDHFIDQPELDAAGIPLGGEQRRDLLLGRSFRFELDSDDAQVVGRRLELPIEIENIGAGHKIPAGFSQEREFWVHLRVTDARGSLIYEVGRVERADEDLRDKLFVAVNVDDRIRNGDGQPEGLFGADVIDGPDVQQWRALDGNPRSHFSGPAPTQFRGRGLINLQNGFLRCVQCIGFIDGDGRCQPANRSQQAHRAARFADASFDNDTGECISNLGGDEALFEIYFPVGALDASRGVVKGPDAIIDVRSAPPKVPLRWTYELDLPAGAQGPFTVEARLLFRAFPPFLIKAFADYEARQAARGLRPSGALVSREMLAKLEVVEIAAVTRTLSP